MVSILQQDFEDPRLDVEGFTVDYFTWRIEQEGMEWHERPELPFGVQPEHKMMRKMAYIFECRHRKDLNDFAEDLMEDENLTFSRYCEVFSPLSFLKINFYYCISPTEDNINYSQIMNEFGKTSDEIQNGMSYGRMVGLMAFGGVVVTQLLKRGIRREIQQITTYTSRFIDKRIRLTWVDDERSWAHFMEVSRDIANRDTEKHEREEADRRRRRWSLISIVGGGIFAVGAIIGSKVLLSR